LLVVWLFAANKQPNQQKNVLCTTMCRTFFTFAPFLNQFIHPTSHIEIIMGRGDVKSRRGKIRRGSHGNTRLKLKKLKTLAKKQAAAKAE
jgi:ribosomal small subunit protein bTHX